MDILSMDIYSNAEIFVSCASSVQQFLDRGGILVWGIVPAGFEYFQKENQDLLIHKLKTIWKALEKKGIDINQILSQSMLSPATCCLVNPDKSKTVDQVFAMTNNISRQLIDEYKLDA